MSTQHIKPLCGFVGESGTVWGQVNSSHNSGWPPFRTCQLMCPHWAHFYIRSATLHKIRKMLTIFNFRWVTLSPCKVDAEQGVISL